MEFPTDKCQNCPLILRNQRHSALSSLATSVTLIILNTFTLHSLLVACSHGISHQHYYMANCATPVIHVWGLMCITYHAYVEHVYNT